jgi:hypothetical protein
VLLRRDAPDARGRGGWSESDALGQFAEEEIVIDEVPLLRIKMGMEAAFVLHRRLQLADDPVGEPQPLDDSGLLLFLRRHFPERDLRPDRLPDGGVRLVDGSEVEQVEVGLCRLVVVTLETVFVEKTLCQILEVRVNGLTGSVGPVGSWQSHYHNHHCRQERDPSDRSRTRGDHAGEN